MNKNFYDTPNFHDIYYLRYLNYNSINSAITFDYLFFEELKLINSNHLQSNMPYTNLVYHIDLIDNLSNRSLINSILWTDSDLFPDNLPEAYRKAKYLFLDSPHILGPEYFQNITRLPHNMSAINNQNCQDIKELEAVIIDHDRFLTDLREGNIPSISITRMLKNFTNQMSKYLSEYYEALKVFKVHADYYQHLLNEFENIANIVQEYIIQHPNIYSGVKDFLVKINREKEHARIARDTLNKLGPSTDATNSMDEILSLKNRFEKLFISYTHFLTQYEANIIKK